MIEKLDWTPEEALRFYAEQKHYDVVNGRTRIIDTGSVASNALKHVSMKYAEMKGDVALEQLATLQAENVGLLELNATLREAHCNQANFIRQLVDKISSLEAENERLRKETEYWKELCHDEYGQQVKKLTAERDELIETVKNLRYSLYGNGQGNPAVDYLLAKYEGEKHD